MKALDRDEDLRLAIAVARKGFRRAEKMTDEALAADPFVAWVACLFDMRAKRAVATVSPSQPGTQPNSGKK